MVQVDLQRVVVAVATREPRPRVGDRRIRFQRSRWDEIGPLRHGRSRQWRGEGIRKSSRARRSGADRWDWFVRVGADDLVIALGPDITDTQHSVRRDLLL